MARQVNSNIPEDGFKSKKDFLDKGNIADADISIYSVADSSKKLVFDLSGLPAGATTTIAPISSSPMIKSATVVDSKAEGTAGGASVLNYDFTQIRALNTVVDPDSIGITVVSNVFTLPLAGKYRIDFSAPFVQVTDFQIRLYDVTNSAVVAYGSNGYSAAANLVQVDSHGTAMVNITASTNYRVEYRCGASVATQGLGVASNSVVVAGHKEIYTVVSILKYA